MKRNALTLTGVVSGEEQRVVSGEEQRATRGQRLARVPGAKPYTLNLP